MKNLRAILDRLRQEGQTELATELDQALDKDLSAEVIGSETTTVNCLGSILVPAGNYRLDLKTIMARALTKYYEVHILWPTEGRKRSYGFPSEGKARAFIDRAVKEMTKPENV